MLWPLKLPLSEVCLFTVDSLYLFRNHRAAHRAQYLVAIRVPCLSFTFILELEISVVFILELEISVICLRPKRVSDDV
jgi:hypothetical protein